MEIGFSRKNKVAFGQTIDFMRPNRDFYFAPGEINVGVVALRFGELAYLVGKIKRLTEVLKFILLLQMMFTDDRPTASELFLQGFQLLAFEWRHAASARHALFLCQFAHDNPSFPGLF